MLVCVDLKVETVVYNPRRVNESVNCQWQFLTISPVCVISSVDSMRQHKIKSTLGLLSYIYKYIYIFCVYNMYIWFYFMC